MRFPESLGCLLLACLLAPLPLRAQPAKESPWHVPQADLRFALALDPGWHAPPDVFLADLTPSAGTLTFDRLSKAARSQSGRIKGEASFTVRPEYRWLTFHAKGKVHVYANPVELKPAAGRVAIPPGTRSIRIVADCAALTEAGFLTAGPKVARATVCIPGLDPTQVSPVVYGDDGKQVGSVTLWAAPHEPLSVLFDCSAGRPAYFLYPVDRKHNVSRPSWAPEAGLVLETRYLDRWDPKVKKLDGFLELWKQSSFIAGKFEQPDVLRSFLPCRPEQGDVPNSKSATRGAALALTRYVGFVRLPADGEYRFHFKAWQGGFVVVDGQPVIELTPADALGLMYAPKNAHKIVALKLAAGPHRVEAYQYGQHGQFWMSLGWSSDAHKAPHILGQGSTLLEPVALAHVHDFQGREAARPVVGFSWSDRGEQPWKQCLGQWPAEDLIAWQFTAHASAPADTVFRWRFDDGHTDMGKSVWHVFCRPGLRQVTVEAVDKAGKVLASQTDKVHVQLRWDWPEGQPFAQLADEIKKRAGEFAAATPLEELLSIHAWARQTRRQDLRDLAGAALVKRLDELTARTEPDRLLHLAAAFAEHEEQRYEPAEKLLRAALAKAAAGSYLKRNLALALADLLTGVAGKAQEALDLLAKVEAERPEVDLSDGWKLAPETSYPQDLARPLDQLTARLKWLEPDPKRPAGANGKMPVRYADKGCLGLWLKKEIALAAGRPAQPLMLDLGQMLSYTTFGPVPAPGMIWFNGVALGEPWRWPHGRVTVPVKLLPPGAGNQLVVFLQAPAAAEFYHQGRLPTFEVLGRAPGEDLAPWLRRARAEALAYVGKLDESRKLLQGLQTKTWPLDEGERLRLAGQLRILRRLASGPPDDPDNAVEQLDALLNDYPMLRLDAEVMSARAEAYLSRKEYRRALLLAGQMLRLDDQGELTRRQFLLCQVQATAGLGQFEEARKYYKQMSDLFPYSPETVQARDAIIRAAKER